MNIAAIIAITILIISFLFAFIYPMMMLNKVNKKTIGYKKTNGQVVGFEEKFNYFYFKRAFYPIVKYMVDDIEYKIVSKVGYGLSFLMPKNLNVLYNPQNPYEAEVANKKKFILMIISGFCIAILLMIYFLTNDLILGDTTKVYSYKVKCNLNGYASEEIISTEANSSEEALNIISERYKNRNLICEFEEVLSNEN